MHTISCSFAIAITTTAQLSGHSADLCGGLGHGKRGKVNALIFGPRMKRPNMHRIIEMVRNKGGGGQATATASLL
jgi:hypothetical protein